MKGIFYYLKSYPAIEPYLPITLPSVELFISVAPKATSGSNDGFLVANIP